MDYGLWVPDNRQKQTKYIKCKMNNGQWKGKWKLGDGSWIMDY